MNQDSIAPGGFSAIEARHRKLDNQIMELHHTSQGQDSSLAELKRTRLKLKDQIEARGKK